MKIVAIAPYPGLKELIESTVNEEVNIEVQVEVGDLQQGVEIAKRAEANGVDVIISRGGTAALIRDEVNIPVVEIEVSAFDLLRIFTLLKDNPDKKGIVGFQNVIENATTICSLLDIDIAAFTVYREEDVLPKLMELQKNNYHIIVGDAITVRHAESLGMNGFLLTSGRESVVEAIEEAKKVSNLFFPFMTEAMIPKEIVEQSETAFVVIDHSGVIVYSNSSADRIKDALEQSNMIDWFKQVMANGEMTIVVEVNKEAWELKGTILKLPKQTFVLLSLALITNLQGKKLEGVRINTPFHGASLKSLNWFSAQNRFMKQTIEKAKALSLQDEPVWILGESGTGKEQMAYLMHLGSERSTYPFLVVECDLVSEENWDVLLSGGMSSRGVFGANENGTIYLKKMDQLTVNVQSKLIDFLRQDRTPYRMIVSSTVDIEKRVEQGEFNHELYYQLCELKLIIPPLRERVEDLDGLTHLFINKFNYEFGKQLAGIRADAMQELKDHRWPGNVDQLKQVLKESVILAEGPFIEKEEIDHILQTNSFDESYGASVNLTGTLKEIEMDIIKQVFTEEGMNHSKTAERLGINRSTLWRKLKGE
ncbi:PrpR N-terminal domain-containing protein [Alkalihalobacillus sp. MEB130]|uniref:sigma-54-dependent Fis family transcriptional regulator n=1 Tax=Alkalihalobacillus sp. MEB130 TaxID=2976704 RepID=UPI0028E013AA|nr:PrpR N-terminal domain-containing protein [Alkalihalobacillus sp. MEB130]MDT8858917.1 PrpR N-terminal domain-containing protein [Alkalihalobacillus sp. MEB130]